MLSVRHILTSDPLRIRSALLATGFLLLGAICSSQDSEIPDFARPDAYPGFVEITHGQVAPGSAPSSPYWLYGTDLPYAEARSALKSPLEARGWVTYPDDPTGVLHSENPDFERICLSYFDYENDILTDAINSDLRLRSDDSVDRALEEYQTIVALVSACS